MLRVLRFDFAITRPEWTMIAALLFRVGRCNAEDEFSKTGVDKGDIVLALVSSQTGKVGRATLSHWLAAL